MTTDVGLPHGDIEWLARDRFGLFIHWGLYSLLGRHEWVQQVESMDTATYRKYFDHFDPDLYDPDLWAQAAAGAGMKFFCVTTKHHDGFCLWDSALTDYKVTNTPYGRDLLHPMVDAFSRHGLRTGLYYSLIDWHHPDFAIDSVHPLRNHPDRARMNATRDPREYIEYLHGQVRELLTEFGDVDLLFFDFTYPEWFAWPPGMETEWQGKTAEDWDSVGLLKLVRELQPRIAVNDRLGLTDVEGAWDFRTPEQFEPEGWVTFNGRRVPWAAVKTLSGSWGYHRDESTWKSVDQLVETLIDTVSKGGSLILNVGPTGRGEFDERALRCLGGMGEWMKRHGRSIYGCTAAPDDLVAPRHCAYTYNPTTNRLYVHVFTWQPKHLRLDGLAGRVEYAQLLNDASEIPVEMDDWHKSQQARFGSSASNQLILEVPVQRPDVAVPVIELFLKS